MKAKWSIQEASSNSVNLCDKTMTMKNGFS